MFLVIGRSPVGKIDNEIIMAVRHGYNRPKNGYFNL